MDVEHGPPITTADATKPLSIDHPPHDDPARAPLRVTNNRERLLLASRGSESHEAGGLKTNDPSTRGKGIELVQHGGVCCPHLTLGSDLHVEHVVLRYRVGTENGTGGNAGPDSWRQQL